MEKLTGWVETHRPDVDVELLNVPPMRVYCWRKSR
jgi:hypothetical protein